MILLPNSVAEKATEVGMTGGQQAATTATTALNVYQGFMKGGISGAAGSAAGAAHSIGGSGNYTVTADANYEANTIKDIGLGLEMLLEGLPK